MTAGDADGFNAGLAAVFDRYVTPTPKDSKPVPKTEKASSKVGHSLTEKRTL